MSVRVLIVDDSATMRRIIAATLQEDPEIEVVGLCADCVEARAAIKSLQPDVVTLDIEMPHMNGLDFLEKLMRLRPTPVVMVSSLTQTGADINLRALEIGAFDCIAKPAHGNPDNFTQLAEKVKAAARHFRLRRPAAPAVAATAKQMVAKQGADAQPVYMPDGRVIAIGSSTGGVEALVQILQKFPANCPPTVISQHLPAMFTKSFAERLNKVCRPHVSQAQDGAAIRPGEIYLAPGDSHLEFVGGQRGRARAGAAPLACQLSSADRVNGHRPSVDVMFHAAAQTFGSGAVGVILTGMGKDGAAGLLAMRQAGAETLGQDEASCIVYGMPRTALEIGAVMRQLPLSKIAARLLQTCKAGQRELTA
jgi:two-component system chemotaxis response regulator CheB